MIQLNLLPDVKLEYIKAQRSQRLVMSIAFLVSASCIALLILLLFVSAIQRKHIDDLSNSIKNQSTKLSQKPQVNKILTVQNQLASLTGLHAQKPQATKLFEYMNQVTPSQVSINSLNIDFNTQTVTITGNAESLSTINQYVDTLKFTTFKIDESESTMPAFKNVVLSTFGLSSAEKGGTKKATYSISFTYEKSIFDITKKVKLNVPSKVTTRSEVEKPNDLFQSVESSKSAGGSN